LAAQLALAPAHCQQEGAPRVALAARVMDWVLVAAALVVLLAAAYWTARPPGFD